MVPFRDILAKVIRVNRFCLEEWMRQPWKSRKARGLDPVKAFADVDADRDRSLHEDTLMHSMLHAASRVEDSDIFEMHKLQTVNFNLEETVRMLEEARNLLVLESCATRCLLNQMLVKEGIRKHKLVAEEA